MSEEMIINLWKVGLNIQQISKEYMAKHNKKLKDGEKKINKLEAQKYIEPIIFEYQTNLIRGG